MLPFVNNSNNYNNTRPPYQQHHHQQQQPAPPIPADQRREVDDRIRSVGGGRDGGTGHGQAPPMPRTVVPTQDHTFAPIPVPQQQPPQHQEMPPLTSVLEALDTAFRRQRLKELSTVRFKVVAGEKGVPATQELKDKIVKECMHFEDTLFKKSNGLRSKYDFFMQAKIRELNGRLSALMAARAPNAGVLPPLSPASASDGTSRREESANQPSASGARPPTNNPPSHATSMVNAALKEIDVEYGRRVKTLLAAVRLLEWKAPRDDLQKDFMSIRGQTTREGLDQAVSQWKYTVAKKEQELMEKYGVTSIMDFQRYVACIDNPLPIIRLISFSERVLERAAHAPSSSPLVDVEVQARKRARMACDEFFSVLR